MDKKRPSRIPVMYLALLGGLCLSAGCIHTLHPSNVRPGWSGQLAGGTTQEEYQPPKGCSWSGDTISSGNFTAVQLNVGHGWRFNNGQGFYTAITAPLSLGYGSFPAGLLASTLDFYYQFNDRMFNFGAGSLFGLAVNGLYVEGGKTLVFSGGSEMNIDIGLSAELHGFKEVGMRPFCLINWRRDIWEIGLWADYISYGETLKRCDENCTYDSYLEKSLSFGLLIGKNFSW